MRKVLAAIIALVFAFSSAALAGEEDKITIYATTYPLYDLARQIGGKRVEVKYATDGEIEEAEILLLVNDEIIVPDGVVVVRAIEGLELIEGDYDVLTIPVNNMLCAISLADALYKLDREHNDEYQQNTSTFIDEMSEMDLAFRNSLSGDEEIACNDGSMAYFALEYGVKYTNAENAIVLSTYNKPDEERIGTSYLELMKMNLDALTAGK